MGLDVDEIDSKKTEEQTEEHNIVRLQSEWPFSDHTFPRIAFQPGILLQTHQD